MQSIKKTNWNDTSSNTHSWKNTYIWIIKRACVHAQLFFAQRCWIIKVSLYDHVCIIPRCWIIKVPLTVCIVPKDVGLSSFHCLTVCVLYPRMLDYQASTVLLCVYCARGCWITKVPLPYCVCIVSKGVGLSRFHCLTVCILCPRVLDYQGTILCT